MSNIWKQNSLTNLLFALFLDPGTTRTARIRSTWYIGRRFMARKDGVYHGQTSKTNVVWLFNIIGRLTVHRSTDSSIYYYFDFVGGTMPFSASHTTRLCASCFVLFTVRTCLSLIDHFVFQLEKIVFIFTLIDINTYYSLYNYRLPNGKPDPKSKHGGCPVLSGIKVTFNKLRCSWSHFIFVIGLSMFSRYSFIMFFETFDNI